MMSTPTQQQTGGRYTWLAVAALLGVQFALGYSSAWDKSPVYDEPAHLVAGFSYLKTGDFRMMPSHPPLAELLAAAPLLFGNVNMPDIQTPGSLTAGAWDRGAQWQFGRGWLYRSGNDPDRIMRVARVPMLLIAALGGVGVYRFASWGLGYAGGVLALALWVFSPSVLAHGRWVTTDLPVTVCFFMATFGFWRLTEHVSWRRFLVCAFWVAALFLTKFSAVLFVPIGVLLIVLRVLGPHDLPVRCGSRAGFTLRSGQRRARSGVLVGVCGVLGVTTALAIWSCFGFRYQGARDGGFHYAGFGGPGITQPEEQSWRTLIANSDGEPTRSGRILAWAARRQLLPEAYLFGLAYTLRSAEARTGYLRGRIRDEGWWYYFPYAFLIKTPIPALLLTAIGAIGWCRSLRHASPGARQSAWRILVPSVVFLAVYASGAISSSINIGHRHLLPAYPFLFLVAAGSARWMRPGGTLLPKAGVVLLVVLHAANTIRAHPHYLPFFNMLGGGTPNGWNHLSDSNVDWGQDLIHLQRLLNRRPEWLSENEPLKLAYFGTGDPGHYLERVEMMPSSPPFKPDVVAAMAPELDTPPDARVAPGLYAISVTQLTELYLPERGPWTQEKQRRLETGLAVREDVSASTPDVRSLVSITRRHRHYLSGFLPPEMRDLFVRDPDRFQPYAERLLAEALRDLNNLRFLKLVIHLRRREPLARVGGSIHLYRVTAEDLRADAEQPHCPPTGIVDTRP